MMVDKPPYWGDAASCAPGALAALNYVGALATVTVLFPTLQDLRRGRRHSPSLRAQRTRSPKPTAVAFWER